MHNPSIYMVALNMDPHVKDIYYLGYDISKFYIFASDQIHKSITTCLSSCTSLTSNSSWEVSSLIQWWDSEVDHLKYYLYQKS